MMEVDGTDTAQDDSPKRILCFWGGEAGFEKLDYLIVNFGHFFATQLACAGFGGFVCGSGQTLEAVGVGFKTKEGLEIVWIFEGSAVGAIGAVLAERGKSDGGLHDGGNDGQVCGGFGIGQALDSMKTRSGETSGNSTPKERSSCMLIYLTYWAAICKRSPIARISYGGTGRGAGMDIRGNQPLRRLQATAASFLSHVRLFNFPSPPNFWNSDTPSCEIPRVNT